MKRLRNQNNWRISTISSTTTEQIQSLQSPFTFSSSLGDTCWSIRLSWSPTKSVKLLPCTFSPPFLCADTYWWISHTLRESGTSRSFSMKYASWFQSILSLASLMATIRISADSTKAEFAWLKNLLERSKSTLTSNVQKTSYRIWRNSSIISVGQQ